MRSSIISDSRKETKPIFDSYQKKLLFLELRKKIQKTQIDFPPITYELLGRIVQVSINQYIQLIK